MRESPGLSFSPRFIPMLLIKSDLLVNSINSVGQITDTIKPVVLGVECPAPPPILSGSVISSGPPHYAGDKVMVRCNAGFTSKASSVMCRNNGTWSNEFKCSGETLLERRYCSELYGEHEKRYTC